ncbi:MAG: RNA methyltransferase [Bacteroidetes bacterium]|nr:RNA methyltransferase [Bacteroidota bacterium]
MLSKTKISEIRALHQAKIRKNERRFIVEGEKVVSELLRSSLNVTLLAALPEYLKLFQSQELPAQVYEISDAELSKISLLTTPNKVLAVAEVPVYQKVLFNNFDGPALMLDGINDPGNLGTIIRTADWFGVKAIFCSPDCVDCFNPKVVQSAMGSLFRIPVYYDHLPLLIRQAKETGRLSIVGATLDGEMNTSISSSSGNTILVMGSESHGISSEVMGLLDSKITIPRFTNSRAESLNAAVACGILLNLLQSK